MFHSLSDVIVVDAKKTPYVIIMFDIAKRKTSNMLRSAHFFTNHVIKGKPGPFHVALYTLLREQHLSREIDLRGEVI